LISTKMSWQSKESHCWERKHIFKHMFQKSRFCWVCCTCFRNFHLKSAISPMRYTLTALLLWQLRADVDFVIPAGCRSDNDLLGAPSF